MPICKGTAKVCGIRVSRLSPTCACVAGVNNAVSTSAIVRIDSTPEYETGDDYTQKNGCGDICLSLKDCDQLKRMNLELELCVRDMELLELLTGAHLYSQTFAPAAAQVAGYSRRGVGQSCPDPVSVEIWSKVIDNTGACSDVTDSTPLYWRTIWPRATFTLGDVSFANEIATINLSGFAEPNPAFLDGCFNDVPAGVVLEPTSPEHYFLDAAGPPTLACGYIDVPSAIVPLGYSTSTDTSGNLGPALTIGVGDLVYGTQVFVPGQTPTLTIPNTTAQGQSSDGISGVSLGGENVIVISSYMAGSSSSNSVVPTSSGTSSGANVIVIPAAEAAGWTPAAFLPGRSALFDSNVAGPYTTTSPANAPRSAGGRQIATFSVGSVGTGIAPVVMSSIPAGWQEIPDARYRGVTPGGNTLDMLVFIGPYLLSPSFDTTIDYTAAGGYVGLVVQDIS
jgi:hypothetical protein